MYINEIYPADGRMQRIHCPSCGTHCDLAYVDFEEDISGVRMHIVGLPTLRCPSCGTENLPDLSRLAIIDKHRETIEAGRPAYSAVRRKRSDTFSFTSVPFLYDPDDHYYIPGLYRQFDIGFLTPVFFKRGVLLKYDNAPGYRVRFASTTYGQIDTGGGYISFGINRNGHVVMWLGDIAKLPVEEQYYLRSENVPSDHSLGSEFYDGQIDCVFTDRSREDEMFRLRSDFIEACFKRFSEKFAHLDAEVVDLALAFNPPVVDTDRERRHVADALNKIYVESFDNGVLGKVLKSLGGASKDLGTLKRLQRLLELAAPGEDIASCLSPLFVLYDLRVAYSHLLSATKTEETLEKVTTRLGLPKDAGLMLVYDALIGRLTTCFLEATAIVERSAPATR